MEIQDIVNPEFSVEKHAMFLKMLGLGDPVKMSSLDGQRIYIVFFILNSLDMLNKVDEVLTQEQKQNIITWLYQQQVIKKTADSNTLIGGFRGSQCFGFHTEYVNGEITETVISESDTHQDGQLIVFTQCALSCLKILGDDLHLVSRPHILATLKRLQCPLTGKIMSCDDSKENDLRYLYSSLVVCSLLNDFSAINTDLALKNILECQNLEEGGFGLHPNMESHGGSTFCAIASLKILDKIKYIANQTKLIHWLTSRQQLLKENTQSLSEEQQIQVEIISEAEYEEEYRLKQLDESNEKKESQAEDAENQQMSQPKKEQKQVLNCVGMQGRVSKYPDSCYTTWIGASLHILGYQQFIVSHNLLRFLKLCESYQGGFKKYPFSDSPDPVHTHFSIIGLNLLSKLECPDGINYSLLLRKSRLQ